MPHGVLVPLRGPQSEPTGQDKFNPDIVMVECIMMVVGDTPSELEVVPFEAGVAGPEDPVLSVEGVVTLPAGVVV